MCSKLSPTAAPGIQGPACLPVSPPLPPDSPAWLSSSCCKSCFWRSRVFSFAPGIPFSLHPPPRSCKLERHLCHRASLVPLVPWIWILDALQNHLEGFFKMPTTGPFHRDSGPGPGIGTPGSVTALHTHTCEPQGRGVPSPRPPDPHSPLRSPVGSPVQPASAAPDTTQPGSWPASAARGRSWPARGKNGADPRSCHLSYPRRPFHVLSLHAPIHEGNYHLPRCE